jgi:hypothetical protein
MLAGFFMVGGLFRVRSKPHIGETGWIAPGRKHCPQNRNKQGLNSGEVPGMMCFVVNLWLVRVVSPASLFH